MTHWYFPSGEREGFTASPITIFQGARLQATVREVIQNSLDAGNDPSIPVRVCFSLEEAPLEAVAGVSDLVPFLNAALIEEKTLINSQTGDSSSKASSEAVAFYETAIATLSKSSTIKILGIHDFETSGLGGPVIESQGSRPGQWLALIKGTGVDVKKSADSLGSFGQGSKAPFALSQLRSVFYFTQLSGDESGETRFQGKAIISSFWLAGEQGHDTLRRATGYFGSSGGIAPILNDSIPKFYRDQREQFGSSVGTSIFIPAPYGLESSEENFWKELIQTVLLNFYFAIEVGNLVVVLPGGQAIDSSNCAEVAEKNGLLEPDLVATLDEDLAGKLESLKTLLLAKPEHRGKRVSNAFGEYYWAIRVGEDLERKKVGIARRTGMLITRSAPQFERFPGTTNFDLFVCVSGETGSKTLKAFENPSHDKFEFDRVGDLTERRKLVTKYGEFKKEVRDLISEFASLEADQEETSSDLNSLFQNLDSGADESVNRVEFPDRVKATRKPAVRINKDLVEGEEGEGDSGAGGSDGNGGGNSTGGSGKGSGSGAGPRGAAGKKVSNLIFAPTPISGVFTVYFDASKGKKQAVSFYKSGETLKERISFRQVDGRGQIGSMDLNEAPEIHWQSCGKGRYKVTIFLGAVDYAIEGMIV